MCVCVYCQPKKPKLGLLESFRVLGKSKYLGYLATLVLGYGLCINMTEGEEESFEIDDWFVVRKGAQRCHACCYAIGQY